MVSISSSLGLTLEIALLHGKSIELRKQLAKPHLTNWTNNSFIYISQKLAYNMTEWWCVIEIEWINGCCVWAAMKWTAKRWLVRKWECETDGGRGIGFRKSKSGMTRNKRFSTLIHSHALHCIAMQINLIKSHNINSNRKTFMPKIKSNQQNFMILVRLSLSLCRIAAAIKYTQPPSPPPHWCTPI